MTSHAYAVSSEQQEINKKVVVDFYDQIFNQKDFSKASKYLGKRYTEHNPNSVDGPKGLKEFIEFIQTKFPNASSEIKRVFADGDYVIIHVHVIREPGTRGRAIFDLFKLDNGKIVEHWDAVQEIPEVSANSNGMF